MASIHEKPSLPEFKASGKAEAGAMGEKRVSRVIPKRLSVLVSKVTVPVDAFINKLRGRSVSEPPTPVSTHQTVRVTVQRQRPVSAPPKLEVSNEERQRKAVDALRDQYPVELLDHLSDRIKFTRTDYSPTAQLKDLADKYMKEKVTAEVKEKVTKEIHAQMRNDPDFKTPFHIAYNNHPDIIQALNIPKTDIDMAYEEIRAIDTVSQNRLHGG